MPLAFGSTGYLEVAVNGGSGEGARLTSWRPGHLEEVMTTGIGDQPVPDLLQGRRASIPRR
ncbi:MAG: hypothetical protein U1G07_08515 [Verrucomicrobiota bacterium]